jgi:hypothetical protein
MPERPMSVLLVEREFAPQSEVFALRDGERLAQRRSVGVVAASKFFQLGGQRPHRRGLPGGSLVGRRGRGVWRMRLAAHLMDLAAQRGLAVEEIGRDASLAGDTGEGDRGACRRQRGERFGCSLKALFVSPMRGIAQVLGHDRVGTFLRSLIVDTGAADSSAGDVGDGQQYSIQRCDFIAAAFEPDIVLAHGGAVLGGKRGLAGGDQSFGGVALPPQFGGVAGIGDEYRAAQAPLTELTPCFSGS